LQHHFDLGSGLNVHVGAAGKERNETNCCQSGSNAGYSTSNRMSARQTANGTDGATSRERNLRSFGGVAPLVGVLLDCSLAVIFYGLLSCSGQTVYKAGNLDDGAIGKDD